MIIVYNQKQIRPIISLKYVKISESPLFSSAYEWILYLGVMLGLCIFQKLRSRKKVYAWEVIVAALSTLWFGVSFEITP